MLFVSTDPFGGFGTRGVCGCRVVFGTLLGPEATGLRAGVLSFVRGFVCFWFPGCADHARFVFPLWGAGLVSVVLSKLLLDLLWSSF